MKPIPSREVKTKTERGDDGMPINSLLMDRRLLKSILPGSISGEFDAYIPELDIVKISMEPKVIDELSKQYRVKGEVLEAYRFLHELIHKLLSCLPSSYWLYYLHLMSCEAFRKAVILVNLTASEKKAPDTINDTINAYLRELKKVIYLCEDCAKILSNSIDTIHEAFMPLVLTELPDSENVKRIFSEIADAYLKELAKENPSILGIYKKLRWLKRKFGIDFLLDVLRATLNIPIAELEMMSAQEIRNTFLNQSYRFFPETRLKKIIQVIEEKPTIRTAADLRGYMCALQLMEESPTKLLPLNNLGSPKRLGPLLEQGYYSSQTLSRYLPPWDYYGKNPFHDPDLTVSFDKLKELEDNCVRLLEGEDLYFRYGEKKSKIWPGHCYQWQTRDGLGHLNPYLYRRYVELTLKDQTLALTDKSFKGEITDLDKIVCLRKEFPICFYGHGKVEDGWTKFPTEQKCTACRYYELVKGAQKLCEIFPPIPVY